jgi:hypothetical protein
MSAELAPTAGEKVLSVESMLFTIDDGFLTADIVFDGGETDKVRISLRTEGRTE